LLMREERFWKFKVVSTKKTETLVSTLSKTKFINNGTLSMLMNGRVNQPRES